MGEDKQLMCEVCNKEKAVGVACVPAVPYSAAYGKNCLEANAHPWHILVANTAMMGGLEYACEEWVQMVQDTCNHLDRPIKRFQREVKATILRMGQA